MNKHWTETAEFTDNIYYWWPEFECFVGFDKTNKPYPLAYNAIEYAVQQFNIDAVYLDNFAKCKFTNKNVRGVYPNAHIHAVREVCHA